jgi:hypothetical protein
MKTQKDMKRHFDAAFNIGLEIIERRARKILRSRRDLTEFVMAMGAYTFVDKNGNVVEGHPRWMDPIENFLAEWDDYLHLTGSGMRFTADGPVTTSW